MDRDTVSQCATIADVERFANNILNDSSDAIARRLQLPRFETYFVADSDVLRELSVWKVLYRLRDTVDRFYIEQGRRNRTSPSDHRSQTHLEAFKKAFEEINDACDRPFGRDRVHNFLDMGFAPGGFTTWLLHANPDAKGVGVTLPPEASRIRSQVDPQFHPRFRIHHDDVIRLASRETTIDVPREGFNLVIANASVMLSEDRPEWKNRIHLVYAQLTVAFQHIAPGGSLVISLQTGPFDWNVDIIETLRQCFRTLTAVKPDYQRLRSIAYIVCQDYLANDESRSAFLLRLETGIQHLRRADTQLDVLDSTASMPHISGLADDKLLSDHSRAYIVSLLKPTWERQLQAIRKHYDEVLQSESRNAARTTQAGSANAAMSWRRQQATTVQPGGADSPDWRVRDTEPHGSSQGRRGDDNRWGSGGNRGRGAEGSWRRNH